MPSKLSLLGILPFQGNNSTKNESGQRYVFTITLPTYHIRTNAFIFIKLCR